MSYSRGEERFVNRLMIGLTILGIIVIPGIFANGNKPKDPTSNPTLTPTPQLTETLETDSLSVAPEIVIYPGGAFDSTPQPTAAR